MWRCVYPGLTNVSERHIASILNVEKSASRELASAGGCRLSHQSETTSREGESVGHMGNQQSGEGYGLGEGQQASSRGMSISGRVSVRGGEKIQGYWARIDPVTTRLQMTSEFIFYGEKLLAQPQFSSWRTTPCRLSATVLSIYSQLPSICGGCLLHPQPEETQCHCDDEHS
jgi:hypothetical protein